ncbi:Protein of unknown function [Gryllus bimaculatus]|nr:Protein of unknown function [Gryllus bimaculatus]
MLLLISKQLKIRKASAVEQPVRAAHGPPRTLLCPAPPCPVSLPPRYRSGGVGGRGRGYCAHGRLAGCVSKDEISSSKQCSTWVQPASSSPTFSRQARLDHWYKRFQPVVRQSGTIRILALHYGSLRSSVPVPDQLYTPVFQSPKQTIDVQIALGIDIDSRGVLRNGESCMFLPGLTMNGCPGSNLQSQPWVRTGSSQLESQARDLPHPWVSR